MNKSTRLIFVIHLLVIVLVAIALVGMIKPAYAGDECTTGEKDNCCENEPTKCELTPTLAPSETPPGEETPAPSSTATKTPNPTATNPTNTPNPYPDIFDNDAGKPSEIGLVEFYAKAPRPIKAGLILLFVVAFVYFTFFKLPRIGK